MYEENKNKRLKCIDGIVVIIIAYVTLIRYKLHDEVIVK